MRTRVWKIYGMYDGVKTHRQRESFKPSQKYDFSDQKVGTRVIEVINSDRTGTNEYSIIRITRNTPEECEEELNGQLSDGVFENSRIGNIEEVTDAVDKICDLYYGFDPLSVLDIESGDGEQLKNVCIIGNDECYDCNEFFQFAVDEANRKVYRAYYEVPEIDGDTGLDQVDYSKPYRLEDVTEEFED